MGDLDLLIFRVSSRDLNNQTPVNLAFRDGRIIALQPLTYPYQPSILV